MFVFVVGILVSVFLHETGHFVTARLTGMKATQFFLGFGPRLWSFRRGETEYGVRALPLGAFVRIIGMNNMDEVPPEDEARTYRQQSYPRRMLVIIAGSLMHMLIAIVLLFTVYSHPGRVRRTRPGAEVGSAAGRAARPPRPASRTATSSCASTASPSTAPDELGDGGARAPARRRRRRRRRSATAPSMTIAVGARRQHRRVEPDVRRGPARRQQPDARPSGRRCRSARPPCPA